MLAGFTSLILNLILPEEIEDDPEIPEITGENGQEEKEVYRETENHPRKDNMITGDAARKSIDV